MPPGVVNRVQLSPYRVVLAGINTYRVDYQPLTKEITAVGYVEFNEREVKNVSARVKGRIDTLIVNETGQMVDAGDVLASLYSPDLNVTMQNLLDAQKRGNRELVDSGRSRLELLGISDDQIDEVLKSGKANTHLKIRSPISRACHQEIRPRRAIRRGRDAPVRHRRSRDRLDSGPDLRRRSGVPAR